MSTEDGKLNLNDWREIMIAKEEAQKANERCDRMNERIEANNKPTNSELALMIKSLEEKIIKLEKAIMGNGKKGLADRVGSLENWRWYIMGGISIIAFLAVFINRII